MHPSAFFHTFRYSKKLFLKRDGDLYQDRGERSGEKSNNIPASAKIFLLKRMHFFENCDFIQLTYTLDGLEGIRTFLRQTFPRRTIPRTVILPNGHLPERSFPRTDISPTDNSQPGHFPDYIIVR